MFTDLHPSKQACGCIRNSAAFGCHEFYPSVQVNPDDIRLESVKDEAGVAIPRVLGVGAHGKVRQPQVNQSAS